MTQSFALLDISRIGQFRLSVCQGIHSINLHILVSSNIAVTAQSLKDAALHNLLEHGLDELNCVN